VQAEAGAASDGIQQHAAPGDSGSWQGR